MAWQTEMVEILRVMIDDLADEPKYTDSRLTRTLVVAAQLVISEITFSIAFVPDIDSLTITPDPTSRTAETRDDSFVNLVCMKAACVVERGETRKAVGKGVLIKDPAHTFDNRASAQGHLALLKQNWCQQYEDAKLEYQANQATVAGAAVMSPFRMFVDGYVPDPGYEGRRTLFN
ncbi:MAG: hypothetical protein K2R98_19525 [Gemmataceae bacterium]|nr:hypothetical protein [Gemmataceae bacterium]